MGLGVLFGSAIGLEALAAIGWFLAYVALVALFGKAWCGWSCPIGLIQDLFSTIRNKLGIRERTITNKGKKLLGIIRYALLFAIIAISPLMALSLVPEEYSFPFCKICPVRLIFPLLDGNPVYLAVNQDNAVRLWFSLAMLTLTAGVAVGFFFRDRFFCLLCPLSVLTHVFKPLFALRLVKEPANCVGCGACRRICPMEINEIDKNISQVQTVECVNCLKCLDSCRSTSALKFKFLNISIFTSLRHKKLGD
jgi:polyferredoxin